MTTILTAESRDGTVVPYRQFGDGPAVVLVPGALHGAAHYDALAKRLAPVYRVCAIDRRGRPGAPPQLPGHGIEVECDDVIAVMRETGATRLLGHSSGGVVALQTALRHDVEHLAVYEPPVSVSGSVPTGFLVEVEAAIALGRRDEALAILAKGVQSDRRLDRVPMFALKPMMRLGARRADPATRAIIEAVDAFPAEYRMVTDLDSQASRYREIETKTLIMCGDGTARYLVAAAFYLAGAVRDSRLLIVPGLDHNAPARKGVAQIAAAVQEFLATAEGERPAASGRPTT